jgi:hypothetical protein
MNMLVDANMVIIPLEPPCSFEDAGIGTDAAVQLHILCYLGEIGRSSSVRFRGQIG